MNNAISFSDINTYQRCPRQYKYRVVDRLERRKKPKALVLGIFAHELLKEYFLYRQANPEAGHGLAALRMASVAHNTLVDKSKHLFKEEHEALKEDLNMIYAIVVGYVKQYSQDWTILHVEEEFIMLLDSGDVISFTPDLVVMDPGGDVWVVDHKTTSRMPEHGLPFGDLQSLLYYSGVKALYPTCSGFIFNRMRKKLPVAPRLTKTGDLRVADLKRIDTTYEVLRDFLIDEAPQLLDDTAHRQRLAELRDAPDRFYWTETVRINEVMVDNVLKDVEHTLKAMESDNTTGYYFRAFLEDGGYKSCSKCPYMRLCHSDLVGWDSKLIIKEDYVPRQPKNPYESEEQ